MKKKTVFIAHPVRGDARGNARKVLDICREVHKKNIIPVAPYLVSIQYLDDNVKEDRELGIEATLEAFHRGFIDELWLFGDRISEGMGEEVRLALKLGIPVIPKTDGAKRDLAKFVK